MERLKENAVSEHGFSDRQALANAEVSEDVRV